MARNDAKEYVKSFDKENYPNALKQYLNSTLSMINEIPTAD